MYDTLGFTHATVDGPRTYLEWEDQGQADFLPGLVSGPYIQHNPLFPNGLDGIMGYIKQAGRIPCEVKRIAIDGNLAFVHVRYLDWGGQETAGVDIFRFRYGWQDRRALGCAAARSGHLQQRQHNVLITAGIGMRESRQRSPLSLLSRARARLWDADDGTGGAMRATGRRATALPFQQLR